MSFQLSGIKNEKELLQLVQNDRVGEFKQNIDMDFADVENGVAKKEELLSLIRYLDLTSLEPTDNRETIRRLAERSVFVFEGKTPNGADKYSVCVMLLALRQYYSKTGELKGLKVAGGIRTVHDAVMYRRLFERFMSENMTDSRYFRIGCSRLMENLQDEITK